MTRSALYVGQVMHQRLRPARHRLAYGMFSLLLDLDELPALDRRLRLFSLNRFNLFGFRESDHGATPGEAGGLRLRIERQLVAAGFAAGGSVQLLCMPRILGHAFNPLSVYFCRRADGALQAILYEVNNTFGERHSYLIAVDAAEQRHGGVVSQRCAKQFHVSPFMALDMDYGFRVLPPDEGRPGLHVAVTVHDAKGPVLHASLDAERKVLGDGMLARMLLAHPLLALKVVAAIHWEALRLWLKRVPFHRQPAAPARPVTIVKSRDS